MKAFISHLYDGHCLGDALVRGKLQPHHDSPQRAVQIKAGVEDAGLQIITPNFIPPLPELNEIHKKDYLQYLETAWNEWVNQASASDEVRPNIWTSKNFHNVTGVKLPVAKAGMYLGDHASAMVKDTWECAIDGASTTLQAAQAIIDGERYAYTFSRPSGHHAIADYALGGGFIAITSLAAQRLSKVFGKVAVLDIDMHHGNGTQYNFYDRDDVLTVSIHGDPRDIFPFYSGFEDEIGAKQGENFNVNFPLSKGTRINTYAKALEQALKKIEDFHPNALVIATGFDTYIDDAFGIFELVSSDYNYIGSQIAQLNLPTLFVQEGGYCVNALRTNVCSLLTGFLHSVK